MSARVALRCPRGDEAASPTPVTVPIPDAVRCTHCGDVHALAPASVNGQGGLQACTACGNTEIYTQKDFPRSLGIAIVVLAALLAPFTYYASLGVAALIDALLYHFAPNVVLCYVCRSEHRGFPPTPKHPRFDREIEERLKFGERAVMGKPMRQGGTAGAPEPEH
ncbi:MAG: hypothetical protein ACKO4Q_12150 [Planctomycetota bacterium]